MGSRTIRGNPRQTLWQTAGGWRPSAKTAGPLNSGKAWLTIGASVNIPPMTGTPDRNGVARDKDGVCAEPVMLMLRRWEYARGITRHQSAVLFGIPERALNSYTTRRRNISLEAALIIEAITGGAVPCDAWLRGYETALVRFHMRRGFLVTKLKYRQMVRRMARGTNARALAVSAMLEHARRKYGLKHTIDRVMEEEVAAGERHVRAHRRQLRMLLRTTSESPDGGWDE